MSTEQVYSDLEVEDGEVKDGAKMAPNKGQGSGCFLNLTTGFILVFLAMVLAVLVGLIVHFAEKDSYDRQDPIPCELSPEMLAQVFQQLKQGKTEASLTTTELTVTVSTVEEPPVTRIPQQTEDEGYRLPSNLKPIYYDLELTPDIYGDDPSSFAFKGNVNIKIECQIPTRTISLNAKNLSIQKSDIEVHGPSGSLEVVDMQLNDRWETLNIIVGDDLKKDEAYTVRIAFSGPLTDDLTGLYLSSYKRGNQTVYLATTQFESPYARQAFPCFDEPAFKAQFNVTLLRKQPMISLSNTRIQTSIQRSDGWIADVYETTPPMSSYLLAFIVCDFDHVNGTTSKGIEYRIWAQHDLSDMMHYALETGMTILDYYGDLFATDFPLKKQDMIAIPDFLAGAMENWGLITYREAALLYKPGMSEKQRQAVTLTIAHELAHQWFGNLVTMAWWDDLWLNEGFATFVEYVGMNRIEPSWNVWEQFSVGVVQYVFESDQIMTSHPLYHPAKTIEEMEEYFDSISYEKGASVIRMIQFCLGEETFKKGLQWYLASHKYSNADHNDLWNALADKAKEAQQDLDVAEIMNTWTLQMGFPVVHATRNDQDNIVVTQKRFLINPDVQDPGIFNSSFGYRWHIPLTMTSSVQPDFNVTNNDVKWLSKDEQSKSFTPWVPMPSRGDTDGWFLVNVQQYGYYRVNYQDNNWRALIKQLKRNHQVISPVNRAQIIDDAWNLANAGQTSVEIALSTLEYLEDEEDYVPWAAAGNQLSNLMERMANTAGFGALNRFIQDRTRPLFARMGLNDSGATALQSYTRSVVVSLACKSGLPQCVKGAVLLFKQWRQDPENNPISPSIRQRVYCTAVKEGDESDWLFVYQRFQLEQSPAEKTYLGSALACTTRVWILNKLLDMALSGEDIRRDEATGVIGDVARNSIGTRLAWDFVRSQWDLIISKFAQSNSRLKRMVNAIVSSFHSEFFHQQLKDFIASHPDLGRADQAMHRAVETVEFNMKWYHNSYPTIVQWLADHGYQEFQGFEEDKKQEGGGNFRLPTDLQPLHYDLSIEPNMYGSDPEAFTFNGSVTMTFRCVTTTRKIVMHVDQLEVSNIIVKAAAGSASPQVLRQEEDKALQFLTISLDTALAEGQTYTVSMNFAGPLTNKTLSGFYLSYYLNTSGIVYLATTQFEPTSARKAFPCMDEPALKATFSITVIRRTFNKALSNMPVETSTDLGGERIADHFMLSKPMSTYLVAFVVCDFENKTAYTNRSVTFEVWSRPDVVDQLDFALDMGVQVIEFYENYFQIPFPLPKLSMIAIPDMGGAMENWGLITYMEDYILLQANDSSPIIMEQVAHVIGHEVGHMWFGDLVSPVWWDDLWLNEGFATFLEYFSVDHIKPRWKEFDSFVPSVVHEAMASDDSVMSHPVYNPVETLDDLQNIFDAIAYFKGASVIRMMNYALGESTMRAGLKNYLNNLTYSSAIHQDLWHALAQQAAQDNKNVDMADIMNTWILQMNYPVVTVTTQGTTITVTQERFLEDKMKEDPGRYTSPYSYTWDIPFTYTTSQQLKFSIQPSDVHWFQRTEKEKTLTSTSLTQSDWILGNVKVMGYYRVNYVDDNWEKLANQLQAEHTEIDPLNRAQIIDDSWALARGDYLDESIALKMVEYLHKEMDYVPWASAQGHLLYMGNMLSSTELYGAFKAFMANKTGSQYKQLGLSSSENNPVTSKLRSLITSFACQYDADDCIKDSVQLFSEWKNTPDNNQISPEVRSTVYCAALRHSSAEDWDFVYQQFQMETNVYEKSRLQSSLSCSTEPWVLRRLLNLALASANIRSKDSLRDLIASTALNPAGTSLVWNFIRNHWDDIVDRYGAAHFLPLMKRRLGNMFNTRVRLQELQDFLDTHPDLDAQATEAFHSVMETTRKNIQWMDKNYDLLKNWLDGQGYHI